MNKFTTALAGLILLTGDATPGLANPAPVSTAADGWNFALPAPQLAQLCDATLSAAAEAFSAIENDTASATLQRVYGAHDAMMLDLQAIQHVWYLKSVHPDPDIQAAAERCDREIHGLCRVH